MRQNSNHKRPRNRGNLGRKPSNNRNQTFDSNGPSVRIRGNAFQVHEKYLTLARDAYASGDRVMAENYFQHAEHYYRVVNATTDPTPNNRFNGHANGYEHGSGDDFDGDDQGHPMHQQSLRQPEQPSAQPEGAGRAEAGNDEASSSGGERSGGERRRRGRRANGHDGNREQANGDARADEAEQAASGDASPATEAAVEPESAAPQDAEAAETAEKPRRRTRRRSPRAASEGNSESAVRDGDEEPVLI